MTIKKDYIKYSIINLLLILDAGLLIIFSENAIFKCMYILLNVMIAMYVSTKVSNQTNFEIIVFLYLTYSYLIEIFIHYLKLNIMIEYRYMYFIFVLFWLIKNYKNKMFMRYIKLYIIVIIGNMFLMIVNSKVSYIYYIRTLIPIISAFIIFAIFRSCSLNIKNICKYTFLACFMLTIIQTILEFNPDTRNALFGVFGLDAYSIFIVIYTLYEYVLWLYGKNSIVKLLFSLVISFILLFCIENKTLIVLLLGLFVIIAGFAKKISVKTIGIIILTVISVPILYKLLLYFYPKFEFLNSFDEIKNYFFGRNNWNYLYGRFQSLEIVLKDNSFIDNFLGSGIGISTPIDVVFYTDIGRSYYKPYYINLYGINHGYHLSSLSMTILDGGYLLLALIIVLFLREFIKSISMLKDCNTKVCGAMRIGLIVVILFYYIYSNIFVISNTLFIIAIIFGINNIENVNSDEEN